VVGDSLTVGTEAYLPHDWSTSAAIGRPARDGLAHVPRRRTVVFALGTNDTPGSLRWALDRLPPVRCLVLVTIKLPGRSRALNRVIRGHATGPVVEWRRYALAHPEWIAPDGVHATPVGYRNRARLIRRGVSRCEPAQVTSRVSATPMRRATPGAAATISAPMASQPSTIHGKRS
jgi:hypothetical protein